MRCVACNKILTDEELAYKNPITGLYEDMCEECLDISLSALGELEDEII